MSRLGKLDESALDAAQRAVLESIRQSPRGSSTGLRGPFGVWVRAPDIGGPTQALGAVVRFGTSLADNVREVAICTVGHHYRARFETEGPVSQNQIVSQLSAVGERFRLCGAEWLEGRTARLSRTSRSE